MVSRHGLGRARRAASSDAPVAGGSGRFRTAPRAGGGSISPIPTSPEKTLKSMRCGSYPASLNNRESSSRWRSRGRRRAISSSSASAGGERPARRHRAHSGRGEGSERRGKPGARPRREPPPRGPEPHGRGGGLSAAPRRVQLDPGGARRGAWARIEQHRELPSLLRFPSSSRPTSGRTVSRSDTRAPCSRWTARPSSSSCERRSWRIPGRCGPPRRA